MKKREDFIPVKQALEDSFNLGIYLGFSLGRLGSRLAPKITPRKNEKEIGVIIRKEIDAVFEEFEKDVSQRFRT